MTTNATLQRFLRLAMSERRCGNDRYSTFIHKVLSWGFANVWLVALALICCCSAALGQQSLEAQQQEKVRVFTGRWTTESSRRDLITRLEIDSNASTIFIDIWAACLQGECAWGSRSIDISAAEAGVLSVTFARPGRIDTLKITPLPDRRLRVARHTAYADPRPAQDHTQEFAWLSFPTWGRTTSSNFPSGAWSALSSSVVVFLAKQPAGQLAPVGYGLLVRHNLVATSYNVVKNATQLQATSDNVVKNATQFQARLAAQSALWPVLEVVKVDEARDVALVRVEGLRGWPLLLDDIRDLAVKDEVFVITNVTDGTISSVAVSGVSVVNAVSHVEITAPFLPIESGAPVFNKYGSVVGISASNPEGAKKPGLVIGARHLIALLPNLVPPRSATAVDSRPVLLNNPQPRYNDEARHRGVEGFVKMRVLVGSDGKVQQVTVTSGLPFGLSEQAVEAARKMLFKPAMKDSQPVAYWLPIEIGFHLK
ncbi:MAG: TonB family protein [Acidobacteriota bacterium]